MPTDPPTSVELLQRLRAGEELAAVELFDRYMQRLTALARTRLSAKLAGRVDPEDVAMSAWRSFFFAARQGRFCHRRSGDLWRLLVEITLHKVYRQARRHTAEKRSVVAEQSLEVVEPRHLADASPTPQDALAVAEQLETILAGLDDFERRVLELRLQGESLQAIASETGRSERTVRRCLSLLRDRLKTRLESSDDD